MALAHLVRTDNGTGNVDGEWLGDADRVPSAPTGKTFHDVTQLGLSLGAFTGQRWDGSAWVAIAAAPATVVSKHAFLSLFTETEEAAIEVAAMTLAGGNATQKGQSAKIRVWQRRMQAAEYIDLAHPAVAAQLENLKAILIPSPWADEAAADARIAQILANEPPE